MKKIFLKKADIMKVLKKSKNKDINLNATCYYLFEDGKLKTVDTLYDFSQVIIQNKELYEVTVTSMKDSEIALDLIKTTRNKAVEYVLGNNKELLFYLDENIFMPVRCTEDLLSSLERKFEGYYILNQGAD